MIVTEPQNTIAFDRDSWARWYAVRHQKTDPGIGDIFYLQDAPDREIRLIEINEMITDRDDDPLEPIDFGVDSGSPTAHKLFILDVTPAQWEKIESHAISLPEGWSLERASLFRRM